MIDQIRSNILQEATNLLKLQSNKKELGISFDELFRINTEKNNEKAGDYEIEISIDDIYNKTPDNKSKEYPSREEENDIKNNLKEKGKKIQAKNDEVENNKKLVVNEELQETRTHNKKGNEIKKAPEKDNIDIKAVFKFKNIEFNSNLDFQAKEKIKKVLEDFKSGKINEGIANSFILQIIKNANIKEISSLKDKSMSVKIKNNNKSENIVTLDLLKKENRSEESKQNTVNKNTINKIKDSDNNIEDSITKSKNLTKAANKQENFNRLNTKNEENNQKDLKSEIKLEITDNKVPNFINDRGRISEPQRILEQNRENLFQQIAKNTKIVLGQNQTKFSTMIRPENFGRIDFRFVMKDGKVNGRMILQNKEVADFFKANVQEIKAVFQKSNVELENIDIILAGNRFGELSQNASREFTRDESVAFNETLISKNIETFEENNFSHSQYYSVGEKTRINLVV